MNNEKWSKRDSSFLNFPRVSPWFTVDLRVAFTRHFIWTIFA